MKTLLISSALLVLVVVVAVSMNDFVHASKITFDSIPEKFYIKVLKETKPSSDRCLDFALQIMQHKKEYKLVYKSISKDTPNIRAEALNLYKLMGRVHMGVNWAQLKPGVKKALVGLISGCKSKLEKQIEQQNDSQSSARINDETSVAGSEDDFNSVESVSSDLSSEE